MVYIEVLEDRFARESGGKGGNKSAWSDSVPTQNSFTFTSIDTSDWASGCLTEAGKGSAGVLVVA